MERRAFLKLSGILAGGATLAGLHLLPGLRAREVYPEKKITLLLFWILAPDF